MRMGRYAATSSLWRSDEPARRGTSAFICRRSDFRLIRLWVVCAAIASLLGCSGAPEPAVVAQAPDRPFNPDVPAFVTEGAIYEVSLEYFPNFSFRELAARLPAIKQLGAKTLYIIPIWESFGDAPYLIIDYYKINPRHGTPEDLKALVAEAHRNGIKVLLDMVTSLTYDGSWMHREHPDWILKGDDGSPQRYYAFPDWGWALDNTNPEVIQYYRDLTRHYVKEFDIDGWRTDSPQNNYDPAKVSTNHTREAILQAVRDTLRELKPEGILLSEVDGPALMWGDDDKNDDPAFDAMCDLSYHFRLCGFMGGNAKDGYHYIVPAGTPAKAKWDLTPLDAVVHGKATSREFVDAVKKGPIQHNRSRANFIEDHDTERVSKAFPERHRALFALIASLPGTPVIHAGQEVSSTVHPDPGGRGKAVVDWAGGDQSLSRFYEQIMALRNSNEAMMYGSIEDLWGSGDPSIVFARRAGNSTTIAAFNFREAPAEAVLSAPDNYWTADAEYVVDEPLAGSKETVAGEALAHKGVEIPGYGFRIFTIQANR